jgi:hypothetical protein
MSTSAIRAALIIRSGLSGVNVFTAPASDEDGGEESIEFGEATMDEDAFAMGGIRQEIWDVDGKITVAKPWQGGVELTFAAARTRVLAIWAELETHLNDTYTGAYPMVALTAAKLTYWSSDVGCLCEIEFTVQIQGQKNP